MAVNEFVQPSFTSQDAATYKASIDASIAVMSEVAKQFAPREMGTPGMGIAVEAAILMDGTLVAAQNLTGIGAPTSNPRIDRVYFDMNLRALARSVGTEATSPSAPAIPYGAYPICQISLTVGMTEILDANIIDERTAVVAPIAFFAGDGYTSIVDAAGLLRIIIGKAGSDNRTILRLHNDTDAKIAIQNSSGVTVASIDASGNIIAAGTITPSGTP